MLFSLVYLQTDEDLDLQEVARSTDGFSGSDLRELCRGAAICRVRQYVEAEKHEKPTFK